VKHDEQRKTDAEGDERNEEMAVGEQSHGLIEECHLRSAVEWNRLAPTLRGCGVAVKAAAAGSHECICLAKKLPRAAANR
jgi:hypothetical protein